MTLWARNATVWIHKPWLALTPEQKIKIEQKLLDALAKTDDSRPFIAAGVMKLRAAAPILKQRLTAGFKEKYL